ncbi:hypothetical protein [Prescottella defluvii]|uniref:hypothetical protein n=1 Tax=Prescottella defluvii TaxID=1323361 RepID=UPI0004F292A6|nr:hypothetical protein [Prescottella defluvii]
MHVGLAEDRDGDSTRCAPQRLDVGRPESAGQHVDDDVTVQFGIRRSGGVDGRGLEHVREPGPLE